MTAPVDVEDASEERPPTASGAGPDPGPRPKPSARDATAGTCPYLISSGGAWRIASPSRDHRCAAVEPAAAQTTDKQRRHCLSPEHPECSTFRAARAARTSTLAAGADPGLIDAADRRRRPLARTAPILLESPRLVDRAVHVQFERGPGQLALIGLMVVAFAIVALTRLSAGEGPQATPSFVASPAAPTPSRAAPPTATAPPSIAPSASPSSGPPPSAQTTYKVKKGDTVLGIASQFGTTVAEIKLLNGMTSNNLKIGQVLKIP